MSRAWGWIGAVCMVSAVADAAPLKTGGALSPQELANVAALARAAPLIRYLHPSDEAAGLDWDAFLPAAIERVRGAPDPAALLAELRALFAPIAPTAAFSSADSPAAVPVPTYPPAGAMHLARWRRYGMAGTTPYPAFREGRDDETGFSMAQAIRVALPALGGSGHCGTAHLAGRIHRLGRAGAVNLVVRVMLAGQDEQHTPWPVRRDGAVAIDAVIPDGAQAIELAIEVDGRDGARLEALSLSCSGGAALAIDPASPAWHTVGPTDLYTWRTGPCAAGTCATLLRNPLDTAFEPARDVITADLGSGIRLELPIAVWSSAAHTLPVASPAPAGPASGDPALRLAAVAAAWGTLSVFHPYLQDQRIDWSAALEPALAEAAAAGDDAETHVALRHLLAALRDGHASLRHPTEPFRNVLPGAMYRLLWKLRDEPSRTPGLLPIALRRFGDQIVVTGGTPDQRPRVPLGSRLIAIDGVPALAAYDSARREVSAGTDGLRDHLAAIRLGMGPAGSVRRVRLETPDGRLLTRALTLVSETGHGVRPDRPWFGTPMAPGVFYVDFDALELLLWDIWRPTFVDACALIFDFRGYSTTGLAAVSNLIDRPVPQLTWQIPELPSPGGARYTVRSPSLYPTKPRFTAPIIALVDGQSVSTVETILALIRDNHLGLLIGETSGGSSGLIGTFKIPGGDTIRFTAMRLVEPDGATLYGRGITPDRTVQPTLCLLYTSSEPTRLGLLSRMPSSA